MRARLLTLASAAVLAACAQAMPPAPEPTPKPMQSAPSPTGCDAQAARFALGQLPTPALAERARLAAGAEQVRVLRENEIATKEYLATRLNLRLDGEGRVADARCG